MVKIEQIKAFANEEERGERMRPEESNHEDKVRFLRAHPEFNIIVSDRENFTKIQASKGLEEALQAVSPEAVDAIWEELEISILVHSNPDASRDAKMVAVTGSETLAGRVMLPVIEILKSDSRCKTLVVLTDNLAAKAIRAKEKSDFQRLDDHTLPAMAEIPGPLDASIVVIDPAASPTALMLYGAKTSFGKENDSRLFFLVSGWQGFGGMHSLLAREHIETPDGFFVSDEFSKLLVENDLKRFPDGHPWRSISSKNIYITGNELTDDVGKEDPDAMTKEARKKLNIGADVFSVLYLGDISGGYTKKEGYDTNPLYNEKTFIKTRDALISLAEENPDHSFSLLVRPHPGDPKKEELLKEPVDALPKNLSVIRAGKDDISYTHSLYAADVVVSVVSTGNVEAQLRGRKAYYLGYGDKLGGSVLQKVYGKDMLEKVNEIPNLGVVASPSELCERLSETVRSHWRAAVHNKVSSKTNSAQKMVDIVLGTHS